MRTVSLLTLSVFAATVLTACGSSGACEEGAYQCAEGEVLQVCTDGEWVDDEDCAEIGLECHAEMGHCMDMSEDDTDHGTDTDGDHTGM